MTHKLYALLKDIVMLNGIYLDKKSKGKLIEILLIVGSIVAAINLPANMVWIFMLFLLSSIIYYIFLQSPKKNTTSMYFISIFISIMFISIIIFNLIISLIQTNPKFAIWHITVSMIY